jgi:hypothetical protein
MSNLRLNVVLERGHVKRLNELAAMKHASKSSLVAAALAAYLSPDAPHQRAAIITRRLEGLANHLERVERDQLILIETVALFIRHELSVNTPIPDSAREAVRAQGRARYGQFVEQLGRHLARGNSLVKDVWQEVAPADPHAAAVPSTPEERLSTPGDPFAEQGESA